MNLSDEQKQQVAAWVNQGLKLSEIQKRLEAEFGLRPTYMEVKFLIGDLQVMPKDAEPPPKVQLPVSPAGVSAPAAPPASVPEEPEEVAEAAGPGGRVSVAVDQLARPGAVASGSVTFSDGKTVSWYLDQMGRLGVVAKEKGYRPPAADMPEFQAALDRELARMGY